MAKVVQHPKAASYQRKLDHDARQAEEKEYRRQRRGELKKTKPERDRLKALRRLELVIVERIPFAIEMTARALAERKFPLPGRERKSAFFDAYQDLTQNVSQRPKLLLPRLQASLVGANFRRRKD